MFVDESGDIPPPGKGSTAHFVLGGLIVHEQTWSKIRDDLDRIKAQYGIRGEIKWRFFAPRNNDSGNSIAHLDANAKEALRADLLNCIDKYKSIKVISVIVRVEPAYQQIYIKSPEDIYQLAYKQLSERFQYFLQDMSREIGASVSGIVVCDHRQPRQDDSLRKLHQRLVGSDDIYTSNYENIIEGLFVAPSHMSIGIQFADLVAGSIFRLYEKDDPRFFNQFKDNVRTSKTGSLKGYGLVEWPKK